MKKSIKISGDGFISEGEYDVVKIMGDVSSIGNVYAREVKINGDAEFRGNLDFVKLNICGNTHINGLIKVRGNIECENITIKGSIQCDGVLQAQSVSIYPYSDSYCNEIKSSKIEILKYKRKYTLNLYKVNHGKFNCKSMKGDDIKLENSDVEYIEYTKNLNISDDCKVEKSVKII